MLDPGTVYVERAHSGTLESGLRTPPMVGYLSSSAGFFKTKLIQDLHLYDVPIACEHTGTHVWPVPGSAAQTCARVVTGDEAGLCIATVSGRGRAPGHMGQLPTDHCGTVVVRGAGARAGGAGGAGAGALAGGAGAGGAGEAGVGVVRRSLAIVSTVCSS